MTISSDVDSLGFLILLVTFQSLLEFSDYSRLSRKLFTRMQHIVFPFELQILHYIGEGYTYKKSSRRHVPLARSDFQSILSRVIIIPPFSFDSPSQSLCHSFIYSLLHSDSLLDLVTLSLLCRY